MDRLQLFPKTIRKENVYFKHTPVRAEDPVSERHYRAHKTGSHTELTMLTLYYGF